MLMYSSIDNIPIVVPLSLKFPSVKGKFAKQRMFPSLLSDISRLALEPIGLSHHSQGNNTVEEDITVRTR